MSPALPPAGWHPDPAGTYEYRYWDGFRWTADVASGGVAQRDAAFAPPPPVPAKPAGPKRSTAGFWVAGGIGLVAIVLAVVLGITRFIDTLEQPKDYVRGEVPAVLTVQVHDPGERIVYAEGGLRYGGQVRLRVVGPRAQLITVSRYDNDLTYSTGGHSGRAIAKFEADTPGQYRVQVVADPNDRPPSDAQVAVGTNLFDDILGVFLGPLLVLGIGGLIAVGILIWTIIWRSKPPRETTGDGAGLGDGTGLGLG